MRFQRAWKTCLIGIGFVMGAANVGWSETLVVSNFDDGSDHNALGGDFGAWNRYPEDTSQGCVTHLDEANGYGGTGTALRIDYDVDSPNPAFCGFWTSLHGIDLRPYHQLVLYVKGDVAKGYTTQIKLELKPVQPPPDTSQEPATGQEPEAEQVRPRYLLKRITDQWQRFVIPLESFEGLRDRSSMKELVIIFDDMNSTKKTGTLYLDEIAFE